MTSQSASQVEPALRPDDKAQERDLEDGSSELAAAQQELEGKGVFDPAGLEDARHRIVTSIVSRRGQQRFRQSLLEAYQGQCAITGCATVDVLEAAHIIPYRGLQTHEVSNGLLLRADIHTLFDLDLLKIHPIEMRVELSPILADSDYASYEGRRLRLPEALASQPSRDALEARYRGSMPSF